MWSTKHTERTSASAADLWQHYCQPVRWPEWDHGTRRVTLDGPFHEGTRGSLKPAKGPATRFTLTQVTPEVGFTNASRLPLTQMEFSHRIEVLDDGATAFTHRVTLTGPLAPLFSRVIGRTIAAELPEAMRALAALAERPLPPA